MSNIDQIEKIMMFQGTLDQALTKLKQMKKDLLVACDKKCGYRIRRKAASFREADIRRDAIASALAF